MNLAFLLTQSCQTHDPPSLKRRAWCLGLLGALVGATDPALAHEWRVLTAADAPLADEHAAFVQALAAYEPGANTQVRTRGLRTPQEPAAPLLITVGPEAAKRALSHEEVGPLLMTMISSREFDTLEARHPLPSPSGALLQECALRDQVLLIAALLPGGRRLGVVSNGDDDSVLAELRHALQAHAPGWSLQVEHAATTRPLSATLRAVLARSDALLLLPHAVSPSAASTLAALRAAATAGVPVFSSHERIVRSGALAAALPSPDRLARQAASQAEQLLRRQPGSQPLVEWAAAAQVRINPHVARKLGLRLPSEDELASRLFKA